MKYYKELAELGCFSQKELVQLLGSGSAAASLAAAYLKKGYVERIRRDLYATVSIETGQPIPTRYQIASKLAEDACISHHSAFEFYGYANQVFYEVYVATESRFRSFEYDGVSYRRIAPHGTAQAKLINGTRVVSVEQAVIDSIRDFEKIAGLEETLRCIRLIPYLDPERLLSALAMNGNGFLYQKTGYILEALNDGLHLPDSFFDECRRHISGSKKYLMREHWQDKLNEKWKLFAPAKLADLLDKGVTYHDAV